MKKLFTICMILLIAGFSSFSQVPWIRDNNSNTDYLKFNTDKVGIGVMAPTDKLTIQATGSESTLGLKLAKNQSASVIKIYSSTGAVIGQFWATPYGLVIGKSKDTTSALLVLNFLKNYIKLNGSALNFGSLDSDSTQWEDNGNNKQTSKLDTVASNIIAISEGVFFSNGFSIIRSENSNYIGDAQHPVTQMQIKSIILKDSTQAFVMQSPNGATFQLKVDNSGQLHVVSF